MISNSPAGVEVKYAPVPPVDKCNKQVISRCVKDKRSKELKEV